jgi:hypothetical protein
MDFELLNYWIHRLDFDIRKDKLYLQLKACSKDSLNGYIMFLSDDKNKILEFFGFDTTIEYDKLTEKNMFEYLCTSTKLSSGIIVYNGGFKGPYAKNALHKKFNNYLLTKEYFIERDYAKIYETRNAMVKEAIAYFDKMKDYEEYKSSKLFIDSVMDKYKLLKTKTDTVWCDFERFIILYGAYRIAEMPEEEMFELWNNFRKQNWSGLVSLGASPY